MHSNFDRLKGFGVILMMIIAFSAFSFNFGDVKRMIGFGKKNKEMEAAEMVQIEIVAPSSAVLNTDRMDMMKQLLHEDKQLDVTMPSDLYAKANPYSSNTEKYRYNHLLRSIHSPNIQMIWALRGGYGAQDILPYLFTQSAPLIEKKYVGYSDSTLLMLFFNQHWGWKPIHGMMAIEVNDLKNGKKEKKNYEYLKQILTAKEDFTLTYSKILRPLNDLARTQSEISGTITGGNLTMLASSIGTDWEVETDGKVLIVEEVREKMHRIDRALNHLGLVGKFDNLKALIIGDFGKDRNQLDYWDEVFAFTIKRLSERYQIPIYKAEVFGHSKVNYPFMIGAKGTIDGKDLHQSIDVLAKD